MATSLELLVSAPQVSMCVIAARISVYKFKVKAKSPGQEPALAICAVTSFSAVQIYQETYRLLNRSSDQIKLSTLKDFIFLTTLEKDECLHSRNISIQSTITLK